jgi:hypothetical protein
MVAIFVPFVINLICWAYQYYRANQVILCLKSIATLTEESPYPPNCPLSEPTFNICKLKTFKQSLAKMQVYVKYILGNSLVNIIVSIVSHWVSWMSIIAYIQSVINGVVTLYTICANENEKKVIKEINEKLKGKLITYSDITKVGDVVENIGDKVSQAKADGITAVLSSSQVFLLCLLALSCFRF